SSPGIGLMLRALEGLGGALAPQRLAAQALGVELGRLRLRAQHGGTVELHLPPQATAAGALRHADPCARARGQGATVIPATAENSRPRADASARLARVAEKDPKPKPVDARKRPAAELVAEAEVHVPTRGNRKLEKFLKAVNADETIRARW